MFFKISSSESLTMSSTEKRDTVKLLIKIRSSKNQVLEIIRLSEAQKQSIQTLTLLLGSKLILSALQNPDNPASFLEMKKSFNEVLKSLATRTPAVALVQYASDLLQFYVFACNQHVAHLGDVTEITQFLNSRIDTLGDTSNNLFIKEYLLVNAYNDLVTIQEDFERSKISKEDVEKKLIKISGKLGELRNELNGMTSKSPYNVFVQYLSFLGNYSASKALEIQFQINKNTYDDLEKHSISDIQQLYLKEAKNNLKRIEEISAEAKELGSTLLLGQEYSLGGDLLRKLPSSSLEVVAEHLGSLLKG